MARHDLSHRLGRWLWTGGRLDAGLARAALLPVAGAWSLAMTVRAAAFRRGWLRSHSLGLPVVAVGNLAVGGAGKTPVASWVARWFADRGVRPGVLLRGYRGGDEARVHGERVPDAVVVADPDRRDGARRAIAAGARVLVLDDAYQRLDVRRDVNIAVVSAESRRDPPWPLPAGPWREGRSALRRADLVVVTRKRCSAEESVSLARHLAGWTAAPIATCHLALARCVGLRDREVTPVAALAGRRVVAASAIAAPESFAAQLEAAGALVQPATWPDHHGFDAADVAWLAGASARADAVVITQKDAVKLRDRWPADVPEPLVAMLDLVWESGLERVTGLLQPLAGAPSPPAA